MSAISTVVGGSKTTLWTYFPSKQDLFAAVVDDLIERYGRALAVTLDPTAGDIAGELRRFAIALMDTLHSQPIVDLHRLIIGEAGRFPELAAMMHARGPSRGKANLRAFLDALVAAGRLRDGDPLMISRHLVGMLQMGSVHEHLLGFVDRPSKAALAEEIDQAIDAFMRSWAR